MKTFKLVAVVSAVALAAVVVARANDDSPKIQAKTNETTNALAILDGNLKEPAKSVFDHYLKIQQTLADDSTNGITTNAAAISKLVKADKEKTLSSDVADEADDLAKFVNLADARDIFKDLSQSLIKYMSDKKIKTGQFDELYCPMVSAYWLQTNEDVLNPYVGNSMPGCGEKKRSF